MVPLVSLLLFAYDSISFARCDVTSVSAIKDILQTYCDGSGQKVNLEKSTFFFGSHCDDVFTNMVWAQVRA
jgi:hypothetical protein